MCNEIIIEEVWRAVPIEELKDYYEVSTLGRARRSAGGKGTHAGRIINGGTNSGGYRQVDLYVGGVPQFFYLHTLVAVAFIPNPQGKPQVNHISGDKTDNSVMNLGWATREENNAHAARTGLMAHGERVHTAKLKSDQVTQIRSEMAGEKGHKRASKVRELAARYGVSPSTIYRVVSGQTWKQSLPNQQHEAVKSSGGQPGRSGEVHSCGGAAIVPLVDRQLGEGASV